MAHPSQEPARSLEYAVDRRFYDWKVGGRSVEPGASIANEIHTNISFRRRRLNLGATPKAGTLVSTMDMDLTLACNLRCIYCFKEKWNEHMEEEVAFDALIWLLYASGPVKELHVNFMGGEPLMRFPLIRRLVPFGKRRAWQMGKAMHFGITTNGTLVTDKVLDFWRKWGLGFHTSIDGSPEIQDHNRPMMSGHGSARLVEKAVPKILSYRPNTAARCTVMPESVASLVTNYRYFRSLGYTNIALVPGMPDLWSKESMSLFEQQVSELGDILVDEFRNGVFVTVKGIDDAIRGIVKNQRPQHACGAGRGMVLADVHGDLWSCHRWNKSSERHWQIGSIYAQFDQKVREELDRRSHSEVLEQNCEQCKASRFCGGGCLAENLESTGRVYRRNPNSCEQERVWAYVGQRTHDVLYEEGNATFLQAYYAAKPMPSGQPDG